MKIKPYKIRYAGSRGKGVVVTLPFDPRKGKCEACGKVVGEVIKSTALHHWWYEFQPKTVREKPLLALKNTSELCFYCHQLADAIRALLYASPVRVSWIVKCLKGEQREKFLKTLEEIIKSLRKTEKNINHLAQDIVEMTRNARS